MNKTDIIVVVLTLMAFCLQGRDLKSEDGLIVHYCLDGNLEDSSGHAWNLESKGKQPFSDDVFIKVDNKCYGPLNSPEDFKGLKNSQVPSSIKTGMTISFFVKNLSSNNYLCNVISFGGEERNSATIFIDIRFSRIYVKVGGKIKGSSTKERVISTSGMWHNVALVIPPESDSKDGEFILYIDGKQEMTGPLERFPEYGSLTIFKNADRSIDGMMFDEIKVYNRALSPTEVVDNATTKGAPQPTVDSIANKPSGTPRVQAIPSKPLEQVGTKVALDIYKSISKKIDKLYIYSPTWIVTANDYMDETDALIYEYYKEAFDGLLQHKEAMEIGASINWVQYKKRIRIWRNAYETLSTQHKWMKNPDNFSITSSDDPNYRKPVHPAKTTLWLNSLGDRIIETNSVLRDCSSYEVGHYAYLNLINPLQEGKTYTVTQKDGRSKTFKFGDPSIITPAIKVNQVGYIPSAPAKYAYLGEWVPLHGPVDYSQFKTFMICKADTGESLFEGDIVLRAKDGSDYGLNSDASYSGEDVYEMDFSSFKTSGKYYVKVPELGRSYEFLIDKNALGEAFFVATRGFYHQRCGCSLDSKYTRWSRLACHTNEIGSCKLVGNYGSWRFEDGANANKLSRHLDFEIIRQTGSTNKTFDVTGGWHDAADYDRRNSHHFPIWDLLGLYEINPDAFTDNQLNIPESGNGIPDLLDEAKWGIDVWKKSQTKEGAVSGRIETLSHPQHAGMPDKDTDTYYMSIPDRESTMLYAGSAALFARLVRSFDEVLSDEYLKSAEKAYKWANDEGNSLNCMSVEIKLQRKDLNEKNVSPKKLILKEEGNEHNMAAPLALINLYLLTNDSIYLKDLNDVYGASFARYFKAYPHYLRYYVPLYELAALNIEGLNPEIKAAAKERMLLFADEAVENAKDRPPYRHSWRERKSRRWGGAISPTFARYLVLAWKITGDEKYKEWALCNIDFHLGCNPLSMSQTTGIGKAYVPAIEDQESRRDGILEPVPGLTTYGIISVPYHASLNVYNMKTASIENDRDYHVTRFLDDQAYYVDKKGNKEIDIPLWRRIGPHGTYDPLNNEFTVMETTGPTAFVLGAFLGEGWMPSDKLKNRQPKDRDQLGGYFWTP